MSSHLSIWRRSPNKLRQEEIWLECFYFTSLFLVALILFSVNLGNLPLLDFGEGTAAQVAKEIVQQPDTLTKWIFPTLWGEPFLERPPLTYDLIAIAYNIFGINEFTTRFPGAVLGAVSVVLVYNIGREIYVARFPALFSALVYLTCLPVVRYSRLAMSDGPLLCFELLAIWAILRSRRDLRWSLAAGLGLGLMALTKGVVSLQTLIVLGVFLLWDTPRLITSTYFLTGIFLGLTPALIWYASLWFHYPEFLAIGNSFNLISGRVAASISPRPTVLYYFSQIIQHILPWLVVMLAGTKLAANHVHWGWGKLLTAWIGIYLALFFLSFNREYGAILLVYPALALAAGKQLDLVHNLPSYINYPRIWTYSFTLMAALTAFAGLHWGIRDYIDFYLPFICGSLTITFAATAIIIARQGKQFISILFWGLFVSFFLLFLSPHWIWELNTIEPVKPIAKLVKQHTPEGQIVYTSRSNSRPSLNFYSDRQIVPQKIDDLKYHWQNDSNVYLLVDFATINELNISDQAIIQDPEFASLKWKLAFQKSSL